MNFDTASPTALVQFYIETLHWKLMRWELTTNEKGEINKRPIDKDYQNKETTVLEATEWLKRGFQIGLLCEKSNLVVVDDDRERIGVKNDIKLNSLVMAKTLRGGTHYYFKLPKDRTVTNDQNPETHVDIRANGWVAIPPSNGYEWIVPPDEELMSFIQDFPLDLEEKIRARKNKQTAIPQLKEIMSMKDGDGRNNAYHLWCCSEVRRSFNDKIRSVKKPGEKASLDVVKQTLSAVKLEMDSLSKVKARDFAEELNTTEAERTYISALNFTANQILNDYTGGKYDAYGKSFIPAKQRSLEEISEERIEERALEKLAPSTGFPGLDGLIRGFVPGHLYTLSALTNIGKTAISANFAYNVYKQGKRVLYFSLEPDNTILEYFASIIGHKPYKQTTDDDIREAVKAISEMKIVTKDQVNEINSIVEIIKADERYDLIIIDHLGYFTRGEKMSVIQEQSNIVKQLVQIAKEYKTAILQIVHLNKTAGQVAKMEHISGSAAIYQDSTEVLFLNRRVDTSHPDQEYIHYKDDGFLIVHKTKAGSNGKVNVYFQPESSYISETPAWQDKALWTTRI